MEIPTIENKEKTIKEEIQELKNLVMEDKGIKEKKFRFPFGKRVGRRQKNKNYVTVLLINENGIYTFKKYQITEQTIFHDYIPRLATSEYVLFNKKGNPMIILPNYSVEPFSPRKNFNQSLENGSNKKGYQILMNRMKSATIDAKKKVAGWIKWVIGIALIGIVIYAILTGGK